LTDDVQQKTGMTEPPLHPEFQKKKFQSGSKKKKITRRTVKSNNIKAIEMMVMK